MSLPASISNSAKLLLSLYLFSSFAKTMDKEESNQIIYNAERQGLESINRTNRINTKDENLNYLEGVRADILNDIHRFKKQLEELDEGASQYTKIHQGLKLYDKASRVIENARKIYITYSCSILRAQSHGRSLSGLAFMRYNKLLACSIRVNFLMGKSDTSLLASRIQLFNNVIYLIKESLPPDEKYWTHFLSINGTDDITINLVQIAHKQAREHKNIHNILSKIDLNKFSFNNIEYKNLLKNKLEMMKENAEWMINQKVLTHQFLEYSKINLAASDGFPLPFHLIKNRQIIANIYQILFNLLDIRFHGGNFLLREFYDLYPLEECVFLSNEEKAENYPIFYEMLSGQPAKQIDEAIATVSQKPTKSKSAARRQRKKKAGQQLKLIIPVEKQENKVMPSAPVDDGTAAPQPLPTDIIQQNTPFPLEAVPTEREAVLNKQADKGNPFQECKSWLQEMLKRSSTKKGEYFSIFHKAHSLLKDLEKNGECVLLNVQEATCNLAERLQFLEQQSNNKKNKTNQVIVPKNYEYDYLYFIETPITYLHNNLRFGVVKRLIEGLGGNIDNSRNGSRLSLNLNNVTTSIHLHDSHNGILEGGRITSLRKFIIEAYTTLKDQ